MYKLFFDGACRGNPGPATFGGVIYDANGEEIDHFKTFLGETTNNVAEYCGLLAGLNRAKALNITHLEVYGDSNLVIQQVSGKWKVKNHRLKTIYKQIKTVEKFFTSIKYQHVYRNKNKRADALANEAFDL